MTEQNVFLRFPEHFTHKQTNQTTHATSLSLRLTGTHTLKIQQLSKQHFNSQTRQSGSY